MCTTCSCSVKRTACVFGREPQVVFTLPSRQQGIYMSTLVCSLRIPNLGGIGNAHLNK
uniref:Uncharacterized protein n=1 Tax=Anguilla anguilla TaxID=7936 RepID=A0A0E9SHY9_ANGAN